MNITITGIQLDGNIVPVPRGLSELINTAGAWGIKKNGPSILDQYEERTVRRNGQWVTILTKKEAK